MTCRVLLAETLCLPQLAFAPQKADPDLGRRMAFSMQQALMGGSRKVSQCCYDLSVQTSQKSSIQAEGVQVVLVGSDIPDLTPSIVDKAFRLLDNAQVRSFQIVSPIPILQGGCP